MCWRRRLLRAAGGDPAVDTGIADAPGGGHVRPGTKLVLLVVTQLRIESLVRRPRPSGRTGAGRPRATDSAALLYEGLHRLAELGGVRRVEVDLIGPSIE